MHIKHDRGVDILWYMKKAGGVVIDAAERWVIKGYYICPMCIPGKLGCVYCRLDQ